MTLLRPVSARRVAGLAAALTVGAAPPAAVTSA